MALTFTNGSSDELAIASSASIDDLQTWTQIFWVYFTATGNFRRIITKDNGTGLRAIFFFGNKYVIRVEFVDARSDYIGGSPTTGKWSFVAVTFDSGAAPMHRMWEGDLTTLAVEETAWDTSDDGQGAYQNDNGAELNIGEYPGSANSCGMHMAHHSQWNRVLSEGEIFAQQFNPHVDSGCVGFYELGWAGTSTVPDWSGNSNTGTAGGSLVQAAHVPLSPVFGGDGDYTPYVVSAPPATTFPPSLAMLGVGR